MVTEKCRDFSSRDLGYFRTASYARSLKRVSDILGPHAYCMRCMHECMHCSLWLHMRTTNQKIAKIRETET